MQYVVVTPNNAIICGPAPWSPGAVLHALYTVGLAPWLPDQEPNAPLVFNDASVLPCTVVYADLGADECAGDPVDVVGPTSVTRTYPAVSMDTDQLAARTAAQATALRATAKTALDASDVTVTRCYERAVPFPQNWQEYRDALRAVMRTGAGELPARPDYPAGA